MLLRSTFAWGISDEIFMISNLAAFPIVNKYYSKSFISGPNNFFDWFLLFGHLMCNVMLWSPITFSYLNKSNWSLLHVCFFEMQLSRLPSLVFSLFCKACLRWRNLETAFFTLETLKWSSSHYTREIWTRSNHWSFWISVWGKAQGNHVIVKTSSFFSVLCFPPTRKRKPAFSWRIMW